MKNQTYPDNLLRDVFGCEFHLCSDDQECGFSYALLQLPHREREAIRLRYEEKLTLREGGERLAVSHDRFRQRIQKAIRIIRSNHFYIELGMDGYIEKLESERLLRELSHAQDIAELGLPVRAYNALSRAGFRTIDKVEKLIREEGWDKQIRNMGRKSAWETEQAVKRWLANSPFKGEPGMPSGIDAGCLLALKMAVIAGIMDANGALDFNEVSSSNEMCMRYLKWGNEIAGDCENMDLYSLVSEKLVSEMNALQVSGMEDME